MKYTHIPISCAAVLAAFFVGLDPWLAWLTMTTLWASREWTQAEYRWIESLGNGTRASMPWWGGRLPGTVGSWSQFGRRLSATNALCVSIGIS